MNTKQKILGFAELKDGWHYGGGVKFDPDILDKAIQLVNEASIHLPTETDAFPGIAGEVQVTFYASSIYSKIGEHYLELTLEINGTVTSRQEKDGRVISCKEELTFEEAKRKASDFRKMLWRPFIGLNI